MAKIKCPKCKKQINEDDLFCQFCGTRFENDLTVGVDSEDISGKKRKETKPKKPKKVKEKVIEEKTEEALEPVIEKEKEKTETVEIPEIKEEVHEEKEEDTSLVEEVKEEKKAPSKKEKEHKETPKDDSKDVDLEKTIAIINVETAAKEGYRQYAEQLATTMKPKKRGLSKFIVTVFIIILLAIIAILSFLLYDKSKNNSCDLGEAEALERQKNASNDINIYYSNNKFLTEKTSRAIPLGSIKAVDPSIELFDGVIIYDDLSNYVGAIVLYKDDNYIKIYNTKTEEVNITSISTKYNKYEIVYDINNYKIYGIGFFDKADTSLDKNGNEKLNSFDSSGYYSIELRKELYKDKGYYNFEYVTSNLIKANIGFNSNKKLDLLDNREEKKYISNPYKEEVCGNIDYTSINNNYILIGEPNCLDSLLFNVTIYNKKMQEIVSEVNQNDIDYFNNYLYVRIDNKIYKYNEDGIKKYESNEYQQVLDVINGFFIVIENDQLKITNENYFDLLVTDWNENYSYNTVISRYYKENELQGDLEKNAGIYLFIEVNEDEELINKEYYFDPDTKELFAISPIDDTNIEE